MALQDRFSRPKGRQPEPVSANPPSKSDISFLMERAAQTSPQVQILRWQSGCETFMLCVNYAEGPLGEPTWELSTGEESGEIFWSVTTENPAEIYRLVMKRLPPLQGMQVNQVSNRHQDPVLEPSPLFRDAQAYRRLDEEELFARRYRVMFQIGHGGMGRVYQACDVEHNR